MFLDEEAFLSLGFLEDMDSYFEVITIAVSSIDTCSH